jgi:hypothetical protein
MRAVPTVVLSLALSLGAVHAHAADTNACLTSYEQTQTLRRGGKLREAKQQALQCAREACPAVLTKDCARWATEIDATIPSVVFEARAADGTELVDVKVFVDDKPLVDTLDGKAVEFEPGAHTLRFEWASGKAAPVVMQTVVREGEKNRKIAATFAANGDSSGGGSGESAGKRPIPLAAWVFGGIALAGVGVGTAFAVIGKSKQSDLDVCKPHCQPPDVDSMTRSFAIADVGFGVGVISAAAAVYLFLSRPKSELPARVKISGGPHFTAGATPGGAAAAMHVTF